MGMFCRLLVRALGPLGTRLVWYSTARLRVGDTKSNHNCFVTYEYDKGRAVDIPDRTLGGHYLYRNDAPSVGFNDVARASREVDYIVDETAGVCSTGHDLVTDCRRPPTDGSCAGLYPRILKSNDYAVCGKYG